MILAKGWKPLWVLAIYFREFSGALTWLVLRLVAHLHKQSEASDFL